MLFGRNIFVIGEAWLLPPWFANLVDEMDSAPAEWKRCVVRPSLVMCRAGAGVPFDVRAAANRERVQYNIPTYK